MNKMLRIMTRILLSAYLLVLILLRFTHSTLETNESMIANKWVRLVYARYSYFLPSPQFIIEYISAIVKGNQYLDIILFFLVLGGTRIGPVVLIIKIILGMILETMVQRDLISYLGDSRVISEIFRELGIIGSTLLLT